MNQRFATAADARAIAALHLASWRATYTRELPAEYLANLDLGERIALWQARLATPGTFVFLLEDARELIGFCACGFAQAEPAESKIWEIRNLHVDPKHHGTGHGSKLFDAGVQLGREHGARELILWVVATNEHARRFYERKGMQPDGGEQTHAVGIRQSLHEVRYRMLL